MLVLRAVRSLVAVSLVCALGPACNGETLPGESGSTGTGAGSGAGAGSDVGSGTGSGCSSPGDCPGVDDACGTRTCSGGTCGMAFAPAGPILDGQVPGDCRRLECDGAGNTTPVADDADLEDDARECTVDTCSAGAPVHTPKPAGALCMQDGGKVCSPNGDCVVCLPPNATCDDTGPGESNDTEATAYDFGSITDSDAQGKTVCGILAGATDVDWYTYTGHDVSFSEVDPTRAVDDGGATTRLCAYFQCLVGATNVACPSGTTPDTSPAGHLGCCDDGTEFTVAAGLNTDLCADTSDDDAQVWIKVEHQDASTCTGYALSFHY